jgi:uncharacterized membrane protein
MRMPKLIRDHARLFIAVIAGAAIFFVLPHEWPVLIRVLTCWNFGAVLFLILLYKWMTRLTAEQICLEFMGEDAAAAVILVVAIVAALLSLVAIVELLATIKQASGAERAAHLALACLTVASSWTLIPAVFALHYADMFYAAGPEDRPLHFPQTGQPVFWDFAYFSFTIAAACQTADVATTQVAMRKVVIAQTVVSFVFNAAVLGFAINVTAGLIGGN